MVKLFDDISLANQGKLLKLLQTHTFTFKSDKNILSPIKGDNIIGIVAEGSINIVQNNYNGEKIVVERLNKDDVFGTMFLDIANDDFDIITLEDSKIIIIDFKNIINNSFYHYSYYHKFISNLLNIVSEKMKEKNERIQLLSQKTIRNKLLEYFKLKTENRITKNIYLPYTFTELANYLGTDRSAMYRELKHLQEENLIEIKNKKITLKY